MRFATVPAVSPPVVADAHIGHNTRTHIILLWSMQMSEPDSLFMHSITSWCLLDSSSQAPQDDIVNNGRITFHFPLSTIHYPLSTIHYLLSTFNFQLAPRSSFLTLWPLLPDKQGLSLHFTLYTLHFPLSTVNCQLPDPRILTPES